MSEMIDIVASALAERFAQTVSEGAEMDFAETGVAMPAPGVWRAYAEAALEAMRVPTKEMILAGNDKIDECIDFWNYDSDAGYSVGAEAAYSAINAMIDAALNPA